MKVFNFFLIHSFKKKETINKEKVLLTLFIGLLEVLRIKLQKNRTKTVGFIMGLSKAIKSYFSYRISKFRKKNHTNKMF